MKRLSSLRTTLAPMPSTPIVPSLPEILFPPIPSNTAVAQFSQFSDFACSSFSRLRNRHASRRIQHGLDDVVVAGASADIAFELVADGGLVEFAAMPLHDVDRRHDHARGAVAALQAVIVAERRLHRMQFVTPGDAFDRGDA